MKPTLLILAAGMGSRYGGLKQVDKLGPSGETILEYSIFDAIKAAEHLEEKGYRLKGIRLDSGDLAYLSIKAREMLDNAGLHDCKIVASSSLDEQIIQSLKSQGAKMFLLLM